MSSLQVEWRTNALAQNMAVLLLMPVFGGRMSEKSGLFHNISEATGRASGCDRQATPRQPPLDATR
jgi:hypothetical protein